MKIIDIIKQSAEIIGLNREVKMLDSATVDNESEVLKNEDINSLFNLIKYAIQEMCTNYVPMITRVGIESKNKRFELSKLTNFIRVQKVLKNNESINFKIINRCLIFEEDGTYEIEYATYPEILSLFDEIDFLSNFSPDIAVFALAAYYTLSRGRFDEFEMYHEQYISKAESIKELKMFTMPQRRWQ